MNVNILFVFGYLLFLQSSAETKPLQMPNISSISIFFHISLGPHGAPPRWSGGGGVRHAGHQHACRQHGSAGTGGRQHCQLPRANPHEQKGRNGWSQSRKAPVQEVGCGGVVGGGAVEVPPPFTPPCKPAVGEEGRCITRQVELGGLEESWN